MNAPAAASSEMRVHLIQGQSHITSDENVLITTTLGSCVAACLRDPVAGCGGMNHFLLPEASGAQELESLRYGVYAMELLVNGLLSRGAKRRRIEARLFGGARLTPGLIDIGGQNVDFSEAFLRREGITLLPGSVRGAQARRVQFWPVSGRARQMLLPRALGERIAQTTKPGRVPDACGTVEFF